MEGRRRRLAKHHRGRHGPVDAGQWPATTLELPHRGNRYVGTILLWLAAFRPQIKIRRVEPSLFFARFTWSLPVRLLD